MNSRAQQVARRQFLQAGTMALFSGASRGVHGAIPSARTQSGRGRAKRCILVYLLGGPSHL
ncbi:MAG: hypothetical protein GY888_09710, partial [Planctomycetaceae bacterium]|nr:hypothetical protein [Planctomycetaceae bacterium]